VKKEEISFVRRMVKDYYDAICERAKELERMMPDYEWISYSNNPFSRIHVFRYNGDEMRAPAGLRGELMYLEKELRYWSTVPPEEEP